MDYIFTTLGNLVHQTAFFNLTVGNFIMIFVACFFLYLAIGRGYEPLLLVPIAFGMLLVNLYPDIMKTVEEAAADGSTSAGLLHYFFLGDEWGIWPSLIFLGVGAMTDFGPLIANPASFLLGAAAQFGIFFAYIGAMCLGFEDAAAAAISIIGGADGPTSIYLASKLGQAHLMGPIAVACHGTERCRCYRYSSCCRCIYGYFWCIRIRLLRCICRADMDLAPVPAGRF